MYYIVVMSYTDSINVSDASKYTLIKDWDTFLLNYLADNTFDGNTPPIYLAKLVIDDEVLFENRTHQYKLTFEDCYFTKGIRIIKSEFYYLSLNNCHIDGSFSIANASFKYIFQLINIRVSKHFYIYDGMFAECRFSFIDGTEVNIDGGKFEKLHIGYWGGESNISKLILNVNKIIGKIFISRKVDVLHISGDADNTSISIQNIVVKFISIYRFRNEKGFRLLDVNVVEKNAEIAIVESYLGKAEFYDINFLKFYGVYIRDSHVVDCSFNNVIWNYDIKPMYGSYAGDQQYADNLVPKLHIWRKDKNLRNDSQVISYLNKKRETFRQLKYAMSKQGDSVNEQKFHSLELSSYLETISFKKDRETWVIVYFSKIFSDFGQSLWRPIKGLALGHYILFLALIGFGFYNNLNISFTHATYDSFKYAFGEFFRLMNPLRKPDDNFIGYYVLIDLLMRIWSSYMIYNIIRATRRFIK